MDKHFMRVVVAIFFSTLAAIVFHSALLGVLVFIIWYGLVASPAYRKSLHSAPQRLWFKRKLYGWGWVPAAWQGWLAIGVYLLAVFLCSFNVTSSSSIAEVVVTFILPVALLTIGLIQVCYAKGEKPRWQWGKELK
jgi:hypothetical protein